MIFVPENNRVIGKVERTSRSNGSFASNIEAVIKEGSGG